MVQLLASPTLPQSWTSVHDKQENGQSSRELDMKRSMMRAPRSRGWSLTDHHGGPATQVSRQAPIPENAVLPVAAPAPLSPSHAMEQAAPMMRRPKLPPPRRSYSVTDKEPEAVAPGQPRPSPHMSILDLPAELHYSLFDFLDPIDGVCLGLAHSRLYAIHRRKYGQVPLHSRYSGPNDMEWAWRGAGPLIRPEQQAAAKEASGLYSLRVRGQVYCRKCGVARCELHRHLRDWMGDGYEYCEIKGVYGRPAGDEAKPYCFMSSPTNRRRCGRHGGARK